MRQALTNRDDFELWLFHMSDDIESFLQNSFSDKERKKLDFSINSLDVIEKWILDNYHSTKEMLASSESRKVDGVARYIGQTFRKVIGGHWDIELEDSSKAFFGLPIITGYAEKPTPICPHTLATASADRRKGDYLSTIELTS